MKNGVVESLETVRLILLRPRDKDYLFQIERFGLLGQDGAVSPSSMMRPMRRLNYVDELPRAYPLCRGTEDIQVHVLS
jgi:hypothetical protein